MKPLRQIEAAEHVIASAVFSPSFVSSMFCQFHFPRNELRDAGEAVAITQEGKPSGEDPECVRPRERDSSQGFEAPTGGTRQGGLDLRSD